MVMICQNRLMIISGRLVEEAWGVFYQGDVCFLKYQRRVEIIFMGVITSVFHPCWLPSAGFQCYACVFAPLVSLSFSFSFLYYRMLLSMHLYCQMIGCL